MGKRIGVWTAYILESVEREPAVISAECVHTLSERPFWKKRLQGNWENEQAHLAEWIGSLPKPQATRDRVVFVRKFHGKSHVTIVLFVLPIRLALRQNLWVESSVFSKGISVQDQQQQGRPTLGERQMEIYLHAVQASGTIGRLDHRTEQVPSSHRPMVLWSYGPIVLFHG